MPETRRSDVNLTKDSRSDSITSSSNNGNDHREICSLTLLTDNLAREKCS